MLFYINVNECNKKNYDESCLVDLSGINLRDLVFECAENNNDYVVYVGY